MIKTRAFLLLLTLMLVMAWGVCNAAPVADCPYLIKSNRARYYDYSAMYNDADMAIIARVEDSSVKAKEGFMTLKIYNVVKGDKDLQSILVPYTYGSCSRADCNGGLIPATTRKYFFFLKKTSPTTAARIMCPYQTSNGWVEYKDLHFSDTLSVPLTSLKAFLESPRAVVPVP